MATTRISTKGQVVLPKEVREAHQWEQGQELVVVNMPDCVILKAAPMQAQEQAWYKLKGRLAGYRHPTPATEADMHTAVRKKAAVRHKRSQE